ncbi:MAG: hypothetical protein RR413_12405 [Christensenellaceae bacterium]
MVNDEIKTVYMLKEIYDKYDERWEYVIGVSSNKDSVYSAREYLMKQNADRYTRFEITEYELLN